MESRRRPILALLFFVSGACGLIYEIAWSRLLVFVFGGTTFAIATVLSCFMGGLALGSFLAGRFGHRVRNPVRAYGVLEVAIGLACLALPFGFDLAVPLYRSIARLSGDSLVWLTVGRFAVAATLLLVPTTLMGATLPLLCQAFTRRAGELGTTVARLYGVNTLGAFVGCVACGFFLLPTLGLYHPMHIAALLNIGAGITAWLVAPVPDKTAAAAAAATAAAEPTAEHDLAVPLGARSVLALFALSGFAAMVYQVAWTRALILSMGASTYAFSSIVAAFILGLALGSLAVRRWLERTREPLVLAGGLELAIGLAALGVVPLFGRLPAIVHDLARSGASFARMLTVESLVVVGLVLVPTLCMGALLPIVCVIYRAARSAQLTRGSDVHGAGRSVAAVYTYNTVGTIAGSAVAGFVLVPLPAIGMQRAILLASLASGLIGTVFLLASAGRRRAIQVALATCWIVGLGLGAWVEPWSRAAMLSAPYLGRRVAAAGDVVFYREDVDTTVAVTTSGDRLVLRVNGKPDASTFAEDMTTQVLLGQLPMMLRPGSRDVCVIGLGSGITVGALLSHPVTTVDVAEIAGGVIEAARLFEEHNRRALDDPRVHLLRADGRNHLLLTERKYDLIVSQPSNPWLSGVGNLFTREFLDLAKSRLNPGGLHCQWIQGYSMREQDFAALVATMADRFEYTQLWQMSLGDFAVLGSDRPIEIDAESMYLTRQRPGVSEWFQRIGLADPLLVGQHYVASGADLAGWLAAERPLTDEFPRLEFSGPRHLLHADENAISTRMLDLAAMPRPSGDPAGLLNHLLLETVERGRRAQRTLVAANEHLKVGDWRVLEDYRSVLRDGHDDLRLCLAVDRGLTRMQAGADAGAQRQIAEFESEIRDLAPCMGALRGAAGQQHLVFRWPLGPLPPREPAPEVRAAVAEGRRLAEAGHDAEAARLGRQILERYPSEPLALGMTGMWTLTSEGPEAATPYLLRLWLMAPRHAETSFHLARIYAMRGEPEQALSFLESAIEAGFADRDRIVRSELGTRLDGTPRFRELLGRLPASADGSAAAGAR
jgi:spermidine synthase